VKNRVTLKRLIFWLTGLVLLGAILWMFFQFSTNFAFDQTAQRGKNTLRLTVAGINGTLGRYRSLPPLIADNQDIENFFLLSDPTKKADPINRELKRINKAIGASHVYVMDRKGLTLASSNYDQPVPFVGKNFSYRPYFQDAIAGREGRFFALGTTSLKRGYYFASPVKIAGENVGVVTVKIDIDQIEENWQSRDHEIVVTDENGIIFMSSRADWRYGSLKPLSNTTRAALKITRKYGKSRLHALGLKLVRSGGGGYDVMKISNAKKEVEYLAQSEKMSDQGWQVHIFSRTAPGRTQAYIITATALFVLLSMWLGGAIFILRRRRLHERMSAQREARQELEKQVRLRTHDLNQTNVKLVSEVNERKAAEEELRKTQADLVQAGKLAALGQMSAALSHELNQPLGAAKSYADNAAAYLDRDNTEQARDNVIRISSLIDRMAAIAKHLRNFARKPNEKLASVPVATVINDALEILNQRVTNVEAEVSVDLPSNELWVVGGQVRLQQVLVNLISNALDSIEAAEIKKIEISAEKIDGTVIIRVRDFGPGIEPEAVGQIFDPFFSTKGVGKGLGLGLSISYNIIRDFDGKLTAQNHHEQGAIFTIELAAATDIFHEAAQ